MAKPIELNNKRIIISRTDSIGDVMLTLPICTWLKSHFTGLEIIFLGKGYTRPVVEAYEDVDQFIDWNDFLNVPKSEKIQSFRALEADVIVHVFPDKEIAALAKKARLPIRVGTSHRPYHLVTCTHRVNFTRKNSQLHEAQLNHELLRPFGLESLPDWEELLATCSQFSAPKSELPTAFENLQNAVILHPKSQGSAVEWPLEKYMELATALVERGKQVVFTGTETEGQEFRALLPAYTNIVDTSGKLSLEQLIVLIGQSQALVACSTGPLHIAGFLGIHAIGLFSPRRPIHPGRWKALGKHVSIITHDDKCPNCIKGKSCDCITRISVEKVLEKIE